MSEPEKLRAAAGESGLRNDWEAEIRADYAFHNGKCKNCKVCYLLKLLDDSRAAQPDTAQLRSALESIVKRFEREDNGGLTTRPGLAWAMYQDARAALAAQPATARPDGERHMSHKERFPEKE